MAKAEKPAISKKQSVINYLTANPDAAAREVVEALHKQGIEIATNKIHTIKWAMNKEKGQKPAPVGKKAPEKQAAETPKPTPAPKSSPVVVEASPAASASAAVSKTQAVKSYLAENRKALPKEISAALKVQGIDVSPGYVSGIKSQLQAKKKAKAAPAPATPAAGPVVPKDAVSLGLLQKAKKLAAQLGGVKEAKAAIDALAQILD